MCSIGRLRRITVTAVASACTLVACLGVPVWAQPKADEPPLVGQPEDFNGAVGEFKVEAVADTTDVRAEQPLHYRLRITGVGPVKQPPHRPDLRKLPKFKRLFQIEDLGGEDRTSEVPAGRQWEFVYQLRPRNAAVKAIPGLRFAYYKPGTGPRAKGHYRYPWTHPIELTVQSLEVGSPVPSPVPANIQRIIDGPQVLRRDAPPALPGPWLLGLLAVLPPALCLAWYQAWRRLYPDAVQAARRRRSRAARRALQTLRGARGENADARAKRAAAAMTTYLWQRLDVPLSDASPVQAGQRLRRLGFPEPLSDQVADLLRTCEAARFASDLLPADEDLPAVTEKLILTLESEPWLSPLS